MTRQTMTVGPSRLGWLSAAAVLVAAAAAWVVLAAPQIGGGVRSSAGRSFGTGQAGVAVGEPSVTNEIADGYVSAEQLAQPDEILVAPKTEPRRAVSVQRAASSDRLRWDARIRDGQPVLGRYATQELTQPDEVIKGLKPSQGDRRARGAVPPSQPGWLGLAAGY